MFSRSLPTISAVLSCAALAACASDTGKPPSPPPSVPPGAPTYTRQVPGNSYNEQAGGLGGAAAVPMLVDGASGRPTAAAADASGKAAPPGAPGGRVADVQEADVYKINDGKLYLLNTYRGFLVYDVSDTKRPTRLAHLPVYGTPVEMFVDKSTVYALLSDALTMTQVDGKLKFQRRNSSQLVTIDISDPSNPKLLQAYDMAGQLREGVSRKIENSIYVVSYQQQGYWFWGWGPSKAALPNDEAWVYSFDVSTPASPKAVGQIRVFEGGSKNSNDSKTGESHSRYSGGITLSATSNAVMVVQNWYSNDWVPAVEKDPNGTINSYGCGYSRSDQESVVSVVDVSDASGAIRVAATFTTPGSLTDQFKQTYIYDESTKTGTYLGIFARTVWGGSNCNWSQNTYNTLESWDIKGDGTATQLSTLDFGKPNETVRGSHFDVERKAVYAITAQRMDPMYALSFADRTKLTKLSEIDGLSGDMDLFRSVEKGQYLLAVGRDTASACAGYVDGTGGQAGSNTTAPIWGSGISVSLIDVRDLTKIRLVQRKCLDIASAGWVGSEVTWNLDQAHKMIGLETDGTTSVLTVPVSYSVEDKSRGDDWYWYRYETAVGIMSWDISRYNSALPAEQQNVIDTHGHFVHPSGEVKRSVLFVQGTDPHREMLNISDSHLSLANLQDLDRPTLDAVVEVAEMSSAVFRFGDYVVHQVALPSSDYSQTAYEFRVKKSGGDLDDAPVVTSFVVGQVQQVMRHGDKLVLFRQVRQKGNKVPGTDMYNQFVPMVTIYDLSDPTSPKVTATVAVPDYVNPYSYSYRYYWGDFGFFGGYYFGNSQTVATISDGIAFLLFDGRSVNRPVTLPDGTKTTESVWVSDLSLAFLDLRDPTKPSISKSHIDLPAAKDSEVEGVGLVVDTMAPAGFYVSYRARIDTKVDPVTQATINTYADYAQRWQRNNGAWQSEAAINIPGTLTRTWAGSGGARLMLTRDDVYTSKKVDSYWQWTDTATLKLLRVSGANATPVAELLDSTSLVDTQPTALVYDGDRIYLTTSNSPQWYGYYMADAPVAAGVGGGAITGAGANDSASVDTSDHLVILDTSGLKLTTAYNQATGLTSLDLMGVHQNKLFVNIQGDGILVVDVASASAPKGMFFSRTLGWASGIEFAGTSAYVPAGNYGVYRLDLNAASNL